MDISRNQVGDTATVNLKGRFIFDVHRRFKEATLPLLELQELKLIVLDLGEVTYLDSSALGMMLLLRQRAEDAGKQVVLTRAQGIVAQVLNVAKFDRVFEFR